MKSGEFLVKDIDAKEIFIPEEFNEEQRMIAQTCRDFMDAEVFPNLDKIDKGDRELMKGILHKAAELGCWELPFPRSTTGLGRIL